MQGEENERPILDPLAIITENEWEAALFTTYALSLSFLDTYLIRIGLKKRGCEEIWVVADQSNYAQALAERQAKGVGQDYRVVPVALRSGVFHPKLTYLHSKSFDLLLVGSGNVTLGGYGKNVEVVEAFRSDESPHIFTQFAKILELLRSRKDFLNPDVTWVDRFTELARTAARGAVASGEEPVRLIHSIEQPVARQLDALAQARGGASHLRVLSPFFDADAHGIIELTKGTGALHLQIGILPGWTESPFPFQKKFPGVRISAAEVAVKDASRGLHAKWIECDLKSDSRLVVTGSINATHQSLCTPHNIEVGVLRTEKMSESTRLAWKRTTAPETQTVFKFIAPGVGSRSIAYASLSEAGRLHGTICSAQSPEGKWQASLARPDGNSVEFTLSVEPDGRFHQAIQRSDLFEAQSGLQLTLVNGTREARCWVNNEWLLELSRVKAIPLGAIQRMLQGESDEDDDLAFLGFLAEKLHEALPTDFQAHQKAAKSGGRREDDRNGSISVHALAPAEATTVAAQPGMPAAQANRLAALVARLFGRLEEKLEHPTISSNATDRPTGDEEEESEDETDEVNDQHAEDDRRRTRREDALLQLRNAVQNQLSSPNLVRRRTVAHWWLLGEMHHHLTHVMDLDAALRFSREWMIKVATALDVKDPPEKLDRVFVTLAAILAANAIAPGGAKEALVGIHEALEGSGAAKLSLDRIQTLVDSAWYGDLSVKGAATRIDGLAAALAAPTRRGEIAMIREAIRIRRPLPQDLALLNTSVGRDMRRTWQQGESIRIFDFDSTTGRTACPAPNCQMSLQSSALAELERLKVTKCVRCGSYLFLP